MNTFTLRGAPFIDDSEALLGTKLEIFNLFPYERLILLLLSICLNDFVEKNITFRRVAKLLVNGR